MRQYEAIFILDDTQFEGSTEPFMEELGRYIGELGGQLDQQECWGRKRFARPINGQQGGTYWELAVQLPADQVDTLRQAFRLDKRVLRVAVYLKEEKKQSAQS